MAVENAKRDGNRVPALLIKDSASGDPRMATELDLAGYVPAAAAAPTTVKITGGVHNTTPPTYTNGQAAQFQTDANGNQLVSLATQLAGEDLNNNLMKVEQRFSGSGAVTSDLAVSSVAGFIHTVTIAETDAAPTAGTIDIYDNTTNSGTKLFTWTLTTAVFIPFTVTLDVSVANGIYVDFTTTADVAVFISFR